jgi:TetR/AcrR family transcriptional regulator
MRAPRAPSHPARARILDAALVAFAAHGYRAASTNAIAAEAGVAKGLVFHHFRRKQDLFLAVFDHVLARTVDALYAGSDPLPADLFERLHAWAMRKLRVGRRDPVAYQFMTLALHDPPAGLRARLAKRIDTLRAEHWPRFLAGVDASRLRDDISLPSAIETLTLLADGIERSLLPHLAALPDRGASQLPQLSRRMWTHFARLRDGLYLR